MITGAENRVAIAPPPVAVGGILAVANVIPATDPHDLLGVEYVSDACADANVWLEWCTMDPSGTKVFDGEPDLVVGHPFAIYAGTECELHGQAEAQTRARNRLNYGKRRAVDAYVVEWIDDNSLDLTPASGPVGVRTAIGILENYAANTYGGVPTLIIPIPMVPCVCTQGISTNLDGTLVSCGGSKVANAAVAWPVEEVSVYITGQITLIEGPVKEYFAPPMATADGIVNNPRALAERIYVPLIECIAARVDVTGCEVP